MSDSFPAASNSGGESFPRGVDPQSAFPTQDGSGTEPDRGSQLLFRRYRVVRELGRGGMGVVVLAQDTALDIPVAVKLVPDVVVKDTESVMDLRKEVLRGMALMHTGIVRTHNFEKDEGGAGIIMEYVDGDSLADLKMKQPGFCFDPGQILPWIEQLCSALDYAHREARIVHRDLKPRNLMLTKSGKLKIADFGTAAIITDSVSRHSMEGNISGTLSYMSPQQAEGKRPTILDDIHAVGATIYELLTGKPPFFRGSPMSIHTQVISMVPPSMGDRREELEVAGRTQIPEGWEETIAACLAKDPALRPQSAMEIIARLKTAPPPVPPLPAETVTRVHVPVMAPPSLPPPLPIGAIRAEVTQAAVPAKGFGNKPWVAATVLLLVIAGALLLWLARDFIGSNKKVVAQAVPEEAKQKVELLQPKARLGLPSQVIFARNGSTRFITRGFLNEDGQIDGRTFDSKWKFVTPFYGTLLNVQREGKWGMIRDTGEVVHEPQWDDEPFLHERTLLNHSGDFAFIQRGTNFGFIDKSGKVISQPQWQDCYRFAEGLAAVKRNGKFGFIDTSGAVVIDMLWSNAGTFSNGLAPVSLDNKWGYIDTKGTLVVPIEWDGCLPFTEQMAAVNRGQKWGYINRTGKVVVPVELEGAGFFAEGLASVKRRDKWGYIDASGVERIKPKFDSAGYFGKGIAPVLMNGKSGLIDRSGTFVLEPRFDLIRTHDNGLSVVSLAGKEGLVDRNGKEILAPEWNIVYVGQSPGGDLPLGFVAGVKRNPAASSLMMLFNEQGRKLWEGNVPTIDEFAPNPDGPRTHQVPANFDTIEKALAQARPGDTVQVGPGTYNGSLTFAPGIRLIGAGAGKTMIRADANQAVLRVHDCSTGLISDVSLEHFGSNNDEQRFPIVSLSNSSVELLRCEIRNSWAHGVISRAGDRSTLTRCTITGSTWSGVAVEDANTTPTFRENRIAENTQVGIYFSPGTGGLAKDNIIESNNSTGIVVRGSNTNPELHGNICRRNLKDGIRFLEGGSGIADGNTCEQNKWCGLAVSGKGSAPALTNNRCNGNVNSGIAIERQCVPVAFSGNTASGNKARTQIDRAASFD